MMSCIASCVSPIGDCLKSICGYFYPIKKPAPGSEEKRTAVVAHASITPPVTSSQLNALANRDGYVWFYDGKNKLTAFMGNFYLDPVTMTIHGQKVTFQTAEAAFQYGRYAHLDRRDILVAFTDAKTGDAALALKETYKAAGADPHWIKGGQNIRWMRQVLASKFKPGSKLAGQLLDTGSAYLVEHNERKGRDTFWSDDHDGTGENMLGQLLMERRGTLGGKGIVVKPPTLNAALYGGAPVQPRVRAEGVIHRTHAAAAPLFRMCAECHTRPVYVTGNTIYAFCSRGCGRAPGGPIPPKIAQPGDTCVYPGCSRSVWVDSTTEIPSPFCGKGHRDAYPNRGLK
ncbi:MAG: NADAR family protein [Verrucomicrobia bacterium]|nr:NADAR family protein [Verrucomicrobiota bacterium]